MIPWDWDRGLTVDTVIVGGGIAGLTVGYRLRDKDILLLEKEDQCGGRTQSVEMGEYVYNAGAQAVFGGRFSRRETGRRARSAAHSDWKEQGAPIYEWKVRHGLLGAGPAEKDAVRREGEAGVCGLHAEPPAAIWPSGGAGLNPLTASSWSWTPGRWKRWSGPGGALGRRPVRGLRRLVVDNAGPGDDIVEAPQLNQCTVLESLVNVILRSPDPAG